jgi:hypothetical protein
MNKADRSPMSLREGKVLLNGEEIIDSLSCSINFTPDVQEHKRLGQRGKSRRWIGHDVSGTITKYKSTPRFKQAVSDYMKTGKTPTFTITGIQDDAASDYVQEYGADIVTVLGAVITGDIQLMNLDSEGELVTTELDFGASDVVL